MAGRGVLGTLKYNTLHKAPSQSQTQFMVATTTFLGMLPSLRPLEVEKLASKPKSTVRTKETRCFFKIEDLIDEPESGTMLPGAASYVDCPNKEAELWASPNDLLEPSFVVPQPLKTLQTESCYFKSHDVETFQYLP